MKQPMQSFQDNCKFAPCYTQQRHSLLFVMIVFYTIFTVIWGLFFSLHVLQLKKHNLLDKLKFEMMMLVLPSSLAIYSFFNLANWICYELTGYTSAAIHFFQVLITLILRISCYSLIILLVKGYSSLRKDFSKMEWRTLLGLVMFGTMGDLISEASDSKDWRSYMLPMSYQVTLALYCAVTCWSQRKAIKSHLLKLNAIKKDYQPLVNPVNLDYTVYRYNRLYELQGTLIAIMTLGAGIGLAGVTWSRWRLANLPNEALDLPSLGIALLDQTQYFAIYGFFVLCIVQDYLPPVN